MSESRVYDADRTVSKSCQQVVTACQLACYQLALACSLSFSISLPTVILSCRSRYPFGCCSKKLRTTSMALRASSGLVAERVEADDGVMERGADMLAGRGGGRIISEGVTVCVRHPSEVMAELRLGSGSGSSERGESSMFDVTYLGVGSSPELVLPEASDM